MAGSVLVPLGFGLVPAFLPRRVPILARWCLWLALVAASALFVAAMKDTPPPFATLAFATFCIATPLSLWVLVIETRRNQPPRAAVSGRRA